MLSGQDGGKGAGQDTAPGPHICACVPAKEDLGQGGPCAENVISLQSEFH